MTVHALGLASGVTTAQLHRLAVSPLSTPVGGLDYTTGVVPSVGAWDWFENTNMSLDISPGACWIDGTATASQGGYAVTSDSTETVTFSPGNTSTDRTDQVVVRVYDDAFDGSGSTEAVVEILEGDLTTGVAATVPDNTLVLYEVVVPAGTTSGGGGINFSSQTTLVFGYAVAAGGITPCETAAHRNDLTPVMSGTTVWRQDLYAMETMEASWITQSVPVVSGSSDRASLSPKAMTIVADDSNELLYRYDGSNWRPAINNPICVIYRNTGLSVTSSTDTVVDFESELTDTLGWHSSITNPSRITPTIAGWYRLTGGMGWSGHATGRRKHSWLKNGSAIVGGGTSYYAVNSGVILHLFSSPLVYLNGTTDYITVSVWQDSGSTLTNVTGDLSFVITATAELVRASSS